MQFLNLWLNINFWRLAILWLLSLWIEIYDWWVSKKTWFFKLMSMTEMCLLLCKKGQLLTKVHCSFCYQQKNMALILPFPRRQVRLEPWSQLTLLLWVVVVSTYNQLFYYNNCLQYSITLNTIINNAVDVKTYNEPLSLIPRHHLGDLRLVHRWRWAGDQSTTLFDFKHTWSYIMLLLSFFL